MNRGTKLTKGIYIVSILFFSLLLGGCTLNINNSTDPTEKNNTNVSVPTLSNPSNSNNTQTTEEVPEDTVKVNTNSSLEELNKSLEQIDNLENIDIDSSGIVNE